MTIRQQLAENQRFRAIRTHQEVADMLGMTRANVWKVEKQAIEKLRAAINRERKSDTVAEWAFGSN